MTATPPRRPRVVAIDASEDVRNLYRELLGDEGYDIATLDCHEVDRETLHRLGPDAVLLDCFLGSTPCGWDLMQLLSLDAELQRVPVVICTADVRMPDNDRGADFDESIQVIAKPFELHELLGAVAMAVRAERSAPAD